MKDSIAIKIENVSMHFNMTAEKIDNLKEYVVKMLSGNLFFQDFVAVDNVSLEISKGEVFGIVGTNGSGKSTLLKIISGILKPSNGSVEVTGNIAPLIELGAGFDGDLSARENIYLNGALLGYNKQFIEQHFNAIVDFAELWDFLEIPIKNYSSGMVARIAFSIATIIRPDILIVDEILSVGDFLFQQKCVQRIRELMDGGVTVVIVSHSIDQIEQLCDRALWIEKSKVKLIGKTWEVCKSYRNLQNEDIYAESQNKTLQNVATEKCNICGKDSEFYVENGVTLLREGICKYCGSSIRLSDLIGIIIKTIFGVSDCLEKKIEDLSNYKILNISNNNVIHQLLKASPNYYTFDYFKNISSEDYQDIENIPFPDNSFDIIISEEIIKHFSNNKKCFSELFRVLKYDGFHFFTTPVHEGRNTVYRENQPKIYHSSFNKQVIVNTDWGDDTCKIIDSFGFNSIAIKVHHFYSNEDITNVDETYDECVSTHPFYYYKYNSIVFQSKKGHEADEH